MSSRQWTNEEIADCCRKMEQYACQLVNELAEKAPHLLTAKVMARGIAHLAKLCADDLGADPLFGGYEGIPRDVN